MRRSALCALATLVMLTSGLVAGRPAGAAPPSDRQLESVRVDGTGEVFGEPDLLAADFAVEALAATVGQALTGAGTAATRMRDALIRAGIARSDLQTSNVSITSRLDDDQDVLGYTVSQGLTAKIRDLPRAGALISAAIAAGGDAARLNGVSFAVEHDGALLAEARRKAFADARDKAELYAAAAGRKLGRVVTISEGEAGAGASDGSGGMYAADVRLPIEPGRLRLVATVTVEWAFQG